jgi:hypothetical protein
MHRSQIVVLVLRLYFATKKLLQIKGVAFSQNFSLNAQGG